MRVLITGARGQLAHNLERVFAEHELLLLGREQLDICDNDQVQEVIGAARPDVVINTAAFVRVDDAEGEIAQSFAVNAGGAGQVARACADTGATLVQISTDYVYGGQEQREPLTEAVPPAPLNVYGASKLGGEYAVRALCPRHYVIRSCGLYGVAGVTSRNGNFVQTMLRLARAGRAIAVVNDQHCTPRRPPIWPRRCATYWRRRLRSASTTSRTPVRRPGTSSRSASLRWPACRRSWRRSRRQRSGHGRCARRTRCCLRSGTCGRRDAHCRPGKTRWNVTLGATGAAG